MHELDHKGGAVRVWVTRDGSWKVSASEWSLSFANASYNQTTFAGAIGIGVFFVH